MTSSVQRFRAFVVTPLHPLVRWVNDKVGTTRRVKVAPSAVVTLTEQNFDSLVLGDKAALVEFYAPW